nr:carbohydrate kinase family protein [Alteromonas oceanisediminis]
MTVTLHQHPQLKIFQSGHSVVTFDDSAKHGRKRSTHTVIPAKNVVDTTSAGDAFNGVYLGARLEGRTIADSVQLASAAASIVIQHPGAIIPVDVFTQALHQNL